MSNKLKSVVEELTEQVNALLALRGGAGSGNFNHGGRPGRTGGSGSGGGTSVGKVESAAAAAVNDTTLGDWAINEAPPKVGDAFGKLSSAVQEKDDKKIIQAAADFVNSDPNVASFLADMANEHGGSFDGAYDKFARLREAVADHKPKGPVTGVGPKQVGTGKLGSVTAKELEDFVKTNKAAGKSVSGDLQRKKDKGKTITLQNLNYDVLRNEWSGSKTGVAGTKFNFVPEEVLRAYTE